MLASSLVYNYEGTKYHKIFCDLGPKLSKSYFMAECEDVQSGIMPLYYVSVTEMLAIALRYVIRHWNNLDILQDSNKIP